MAWPGYPDSFDPGWWREVLTTPPIFTGTGALTSSSTTVSGFSATYQLMAVTPVIGQQVAGTGVPSNTYVASSPAPTATSFTLTNAASASGTTVLTIGAEPVSLAEAKAWARVEFPDDDSLIQDIITGTREWCEGPELKRALMLQGRTYYSMGFPWSGGYYNRLIRSMGPNPWWLPTAQGIIILPYPNLQNIVSIQYLDPASGTLLTIPSSQYIFTPNSSPGRIMPQYGAVWPLPRPVIDSVRITYSVGYGPNASDIPAAPRLAMRSMIAATYENRESYMEGGGLKITGMAQRFMDVERTGAYY
jgi:hypothetical protein